MSWEDMVLKVDIALTRDRMRWIGVRVYCLMGVNGLEMYQRHIL